MAGSHQHKMSPRLLKEIMLQQEIARQLRLGDAQRDAWMRQDRNGLADHRVQESKARQAHAQAG